MGQSNIGWIWPRAMVRQALPLGISACMALESGTHSFGKYLFSSYLTRRRSSRPFSPAEAVARTSGPGLSWGKALCCRVRGIRGRVPPGVSEHSSPCQQDRQKLEPQTSRPGRSSRNPLVCVLVFRVKNRRLRMGSELPKATGLMGQSRD